LPLPKCSKFFFLNERAQACAYLIEKEGITQNRLAGQYKSDYSRAKSVAKPFAPAAIQMDDSLLIFAKMVATEDSWSLKTRSFRSFQISFREECQTAGGLKRDVGRCSDVGPPL
jgi:hypothetical protein